MKQVGKMIQDLFDDIKRMNKRQVCINTIYISLVVPIKLDMAIDWNEEFTKPTVIFPLFSRSCTKY